MLGVLWHPRGLVSLLTGCQWWDIDESSAGYCLGTARLKHQLAKAVWTQLIRLKNGKTKLVRASNRRKQVFSVFENIKTALLDQTIGLSGLAFQSSHGAGLEVWWDCKNREHIRSNTSLRYPLSLQQLWLGGFLSQKWFLFIFIFISENTYLLQHRELQKVLLLPAPTAQCSWPSWVQCDFLGAGQLSPAALLPCGAVVCLAWRTACAHGVSRMCSAAFGFWLWCQHGSEGWLSGRKRAALSALKLVREETQAVVYLFKIVLSAEADLALKWEKSVCCCYKHLCVCCLVTTLPWMPWFPCPSAGMGPVFAVTGTATCPLLLYVPCSSNKIWFAFGITD